MVPPQKVSGMSQLCNSILVMSMVRKNKLVAKAQLKIPAGIRDLFDDPPFLASENQNVYRNLACTIIDQLQPRDPFEWLWVKDVVSHTWDIQRLRAVKQQVIELARSARAEKIATEVSQKRKPHLSEMSPAQAEALFIKSCEETDAEIRKERADFEALSPEAAEAWINFVETDTRARRPEIEKIQPWWTAIRASEAYQKMLKAPVRPLKERIDPETKRQIMSELNTEADTAQAFVDSIDVQEKLERMIISLEQRRNKTLREIVLHRGIWLRRPRNVQVAEDKEFPRTHNGPAQDGLRPQDRS